MRPSPAGKSNFKDSPHNMGKRVELKQSGVVFKADDHTYYLPDKEKFLSGITDVITRQLFPDSYAGVFEEVLAKAADYGNKVHSSIERFDSLWENDGTLEVADYIRLCQENSLSHQASEYTVTDNENYASNIDKVFRTGDASFILADLKTYGAMTSEKLEYCRWQLSIYGYLFELQNKGARVEKLLILHIRNKPKKDGSFDHIANIIEVKRIPAEICMELLECDLKGESFKNPYSIPESVAKKEDMIRSLTAVKKQCEEKLNAIKLSILETMASAGVKTWETDTMRLTRKESSVRLSFNLAAYRKDNPKFDPSPYMKSSVVSESLTITL